MTIKDDTAEIRLYNIARGEIRPRSHRPHIDGMLLGHVVSSKTRLCHRPHLAAGRPDRAFRSTIAVGRTLREFDVDKPSVTLSAVTARRSRRRHHAALARNRPCICLRVGSHRPSSCSTTGDFSAVFVVATGDTSRDRLETGLFRRQAAADVGAFDRRAVTDRQI